MRKKRHDSVSYEKNIDFTKVKDVEGFKHFFEEGFEKSSKHLKSLIIKKLTTTYTEEYQKDKTKKYGNINKGFSKEEFKRFLEHERKPQMKLAWILQRYRGFRISETCELNIKDINKIRKIITIRTKKADILDEIIIEGEFEKHLYRYLEEYENEIKNSNGYLMFNNPEKSKNVKLTVDYMRKCFNETRKLAQLDDIYGYSKENGRNKNKKPLYRLTTHSLRHLAITEFYNNTKDIILTQKFARHKDIESTLVYVYKSNEEIREALQGGFYNKYNRNQIEEITKAVLSNLTGQH